MHDSLKVTLFIIEKCSSLIGIRSEEVRCLLPYVRNLTFYSFFFSFL